LDAFGILNIVLIVVVVLAVIFGALFYLNRWALKKMDTQKDFIDKNKQVHSIYVIDKKRQKPGEANLPKQVMAQLPKYYKHMKLNLVKAKIGPQILTLMCEKKIYDVIPVKKNIKVEIAGMYISSVIGMKNAEEVKAMNKAKKVKEKEQKSKEKQEMKEAKKKK